MEDRSYIFTLFGATGDLARKKIIPAFFELFTKGKLPKEWKLVLFIRKSWQRADIEKFVTEVLPGADVASFAEHLFAFEGDIEDVDSFRKLKEFSHGLGKFDESLFFLSVSPVLYVKAVSNICDANISGETSKILIEKPFGVNSEGAKELNSLLHTFLPEERIFRVDHYLAKDAMEDLLDLTGGVDTVEARFIENKTVGNRGAFYDATGAFLDVGQNHLLMMLARSLRSIRHTGSLLEVLQGLTVLPSGTVRAQYEGYTSEKDVNPQSETETYFKVRLRSSEIDCILEGGKGFNQPDIAVEVAYEYKEKTIIDFSQKRAGSLDPHAKILFAAMTGDRSLFVSREEAEEEWRIADEVTRELRKAPLQVYPKGTIYKENIFE
ncbi:MAG: hypothetical protein WC761_02425 [Candidatus Paceibacterota bacterium]|jgi:glucose-6-phosphate 1-dehydrogenase